MKPDVLAAIVATLLAAVVAVVVIVLSVGHVVQWLLSQLPA